MTDVFSKEKRSEIMGKIRSKDTNMERIFSMENPTAIDHPDFLPYHPDFLLGGVPIFLDSPFWHGLVSVEKLENMKPYWKNKMLRNIVRDWCAIAFYESVGEYKRIGDRTWKDILRDT